MRILVVGGAGYIGSHVVRETLRAGHEPVVLDDYSTGHPEAVDGVEQIEADCTDLRAVRAAFESARFDAVFHLAAKASVPESIERPEWYYHNNVGGTSTIVRAMIETGCEKFVFSSTCAIYGSIGANEAALTEALPCHPEHPYGWSKLQSERILQDVSKTRPFRYIALRYFNAAGADLAGDVGEDHGEDERHLIPLVVLKALGLRKSFKVFGTDFDTADGTCVRDFVHVTDIARAHLCALDALDRAPNQAFNLGFEKGYSVREVVEKVREISGLDFEVEEAGRRAGDPARLVASSAAARRELGWEPQYSDLDTVIKSAWDWHRSHPTGYGQPVESGSTARRKRSRRFGELAIELGIVNRDDVDRALERQEREAKGGHEHKLIGLHMLEMGLLSTSQLLEILRNYEDTP